MKLPVSVLKDYVKTDLSAEALGDLLTMTGFELEEILDLSDRIAVIFKGRIIGTLDRGTADSRKIGILMAGVRNDEAV